MDEAIHFKVKPEYKKLYFDVYIWANPSAMLRNLRNIHGGSWKDSVGVFVVPGERPRLCLGEIHLNRKWLDHDTVAHEAQHAAIWWARHIKLPIGAMVTPDLPDSARIEERFCEGMGAIMHQINLVLQSENYFQKEL